MKEAEKLGIGIIFLPSYSPDLKPIEYIWKSIKRIISATFIRDINDMRNVLREAFYRFCQKLSFTAGWMLGKLEKWTAVKFKTGLLGTLLTSK
jgi:hypothetical protein